MNRVTHYLRFPAQTFWNTPFPQNTLNSGYPENEHFITPACLMHTYTFLKTYKQNKKKHMHAYRKIKKKNRNEPALNKSTHAI